MNESNPPTGQASGRRTAIVIVAAGSGQRLGAGLPKAAVAVGGRSLAAHALDVAVDGSLARRVVVVTPPGDQRLDADVAEAAERGAARGVEVVSVPGGDTRQASVLAGLGQIEGAERVLIHDAARAFTSAGQYRRVAEALDAGAVAAVPGVAVVDTLKSVDPRGRVTGTPDRESLRAVQTPQGFDAALLIKAHAAAGGQDASDDAALMEARGAIVQVVEGEQDAFKVTLPSDLRRAEEVLARRSAAAQERASDAEPASAPGKPPASAGAASLSPRIGLGIDVHAFAEDDATELWLAGLHWPGERGLSGHSDGDAVAHAACDALFSAAGIGDLGTHFGTDRPEYAGASGSRLLAEAARLVREAGFDILNVAVQFVGNRPKFSRRRQEADAVLTGVLGAPLSVTATTSDGLGFEGEGAGVSARAVALVVPHVD